VKNVQGQGDGIKSGCNLEMGTQPFQRLGKYKGGPRTCSLAQQLRGEVTNAAGWLKPLPGPENQVKLYNFLLQASKRIQGLTGRKSEDLRLYK
jgi:hypothetical protein